MIIVVVVFVVLLLFVFIVADIVFVLNIVVVVVVAVAVIFIFIIVIIFISLSLELLPIVLLPYPPSWLEVSTRIAKVAMLLCILSTCVLATLEIEPVKFEEILPRLCSALIDRSSLVYFVQVYT